MRPETAEIYPIVRLIAVLLAITVGGSAMFATIVILQPVATEFGVNRGTASIPYMAFMLCFGIGGIAMGRLADRVGILAPVLIAAVGLPAGLWLSAQASDIWQLALAVGLVAGLFGTAPIFGPLLADISFWFERRRGLAVAIAISGSYLAGTVWPPILQHFIDAQGWRETMEGLAIFTFFVMLPLAAVLYRRPAHGTAGSVSQTPSGLARPLGLAPNGLQCLLCCAGIGCCAAMAMPQVHIVPYATDLGYASARGAEMLSLMLGGGIVSRLLSGWISDRVGGLKTLALGSLLQGLAIAAFFTADTLSALYVLSFAFGLSQGGIVPSYTIIIRTYFPVGEAGWRIGAALLFTMIGMALGGWMAGALYDLTGSYTLSFFNAIAFNIANFAIAAYLLARSRRAALPA